MSDRLFLEVEKRFLNPGIEVFTNYQSYNEELEDELDMVDMCIDEIDK